MKVLGVIGLPGSGKSLFFDLAKSKGAIVANMGDIIREKAKERGIKNLSKLKKDELIESRNKINEKIDIFSKNQGIPGRKPGC